MMPSGKTFTFYYIKQTFVCILQFYYYYLFADVPIREHTKECYTKVQPKATLLPFIPLYIWLAPKRHRADFILSHEERAHLFALLHKLKRSRNQGKIGNERVRFSYGVILAHRHKIHRFTREHSADITEILRHSVV